MDSENLYELLQSPEYSGNGYQKVDLGEDMFLIKQHMFHHWQPRYIIDERDKFAFEFASSTWHLRTISSLDIDFDSMDDPSMLSAQWEALALHMPLSSEIGNYVNGIAEFCWNLTYEEPFIEDNPKTAKPKEVSIRGFIDRRGAAVTKLRYVGEDPDALEEDRQEAELMALKKLDVELFSKNLYEYLQAPRFSSDEHFRTEDLEEDMKRVDELVLGYWKPRFLIDERSKSAVEFLDSKMYACTVGTSDIDWDSVSKLGDNCYNKAWSRNMFFPTTISRYTNGVAKVMWQLHPDGRYYMDDDGYGMTNDVEVTIYGFIDRKGKVVSKFRYLEDSEFQSTITSMRAEAEANAKKQD